MADVVSRMVWFTLVACAVAYAVYLVAGSVVHASSAGTGAPIIIRDELVARSHHLTGMLMVPSSCHQLSVRVETIAETDYRLVFQTWQEPSTDCSASEVPRIFHAELFAPLTGVRFIATLDGASLPIVVEPYIPAPTAASTTPA